MVQNQFNIEEAMGQPIIWWVPNRPDVKIKYVDIEDVPPFAPNGVVNAYLNGGGTLTAAVKAYIHAYGNLGGVGTLVVGQKWKAPTTAPLASSGGTTAKVATKQNVGNIADGALSAVVVKIDPSST